MNNSSDVKTAILKTLAYREVFEYPLTFYQLYVYLISQEPVPFDDFKEELRNLLTEKKIFYLDGYFHTGDSEVVRKRKENETASLAHLEKAKNVAAKISKIPWVKFVGVTGAVSAGNAPAQDDIDLFIVSSSGKVWTTRFFVVLLLKVLGLYRSDKSPYGKFCPNLFVQEDSLFWGNAISVYIAHEIYMMVPVFDRSEYYFRFLSENPWTKDFLPHVKYQKLDDIVFPTKRIDFVEKIFRNLQLWYMRKKITNEVTTDKVIHFKRDDNSGWIQASFSKKFKELTAESKTPKLTIN